MKKKTDLYTKFNNSKNATNRKTNSTINKRPYNKILLQKN